ncbi:hypothetical protein NIASO_01920 [Niabella soli DSM 19437]|uniref:Uncharacterized protein n=1 Tax=Niabella soli DSM 19437 TaxID=929713 RepID=W0F6V8_9BACT|nr:hypothetical protein NIASO_01920 [Niabella soli DSM 19437]
MNTINTQRLQRLNHVPYLDAHANAFEGTEIFQGQYQTYDKITRLLYVSLEMTAFDTASFKTAV